MSLGKGLESLIPPKKPNGGQGGNPPQEESKPQQPAVSGPVSEPAKSTYQNPAPPADLPVAAAAKIEEEKELPEPEEESLLSPPAQVPEIAPRERPEPQPALKPRVSYTPVKHAEAVHKPRREDAIFYLETAKILPNPHQPRKHFDSEAIRDLAASIREFGVLQPIVVTKHEKETAQGTEVHYELIAGERRLLAAKSLGMEHIPAIIRNVDLDRERLEMAIIENLQREDLNGIEMGRAFARLQDEFRLTQREIASRLGKSRESVANTLRLLDLPSYIQEAIESKKITESHGLFLLGVEEPAVQQALFNDLLVNKLTIRELKQKARLSKGGREEAPGPAFDNPEFKVFEEELSANLGAPVSIEKRGAKGQITIKFYSEEELSELLKKLQTED